MHFPEDFPSSRTVMLTREMTGSGNIQQNVEEESLELR